MINTKPTDDKSQCWIITEGIAGTENQCIGIANSLGIDFAIKRINLNEPWKSLSPYLGFECPKAFSPELVPPWPELVIAGGRKSIACSRYIKRKSGGKTLTVQVQDPRVSAKHFDLIAVPKHDPLRGSNVIVTEATPNKITQTLLSGAKEEFSTLSRLPSPRVAVLIGGSSQAYDMTPQITQKLADTLSKLDASLMITCSRRTGDENLKILKNALNTNQNFFWDGSGANPYLGILAWADYILVTADSASMISESCTTGKPTFMIPLEGGSKRINAMHNNLIESGKLKIFDGKLVTYDYEPLNDAKMVANEIKSRFGALLSLRDC